MAKSVAVGCFGKNTGRPVEMKILHITPSYKPAYIYGGPTRSISELCEALVRENISVDVFTTTANGKLELNIPSSEKIMVDGVGVTYFSRQTKDHTHFSIGLLLKVFLQCRKYDAVHIHSWWNLVTIFSVLICRLRGVTPVLSPRGMLSPFTFSKSSARIYFHKWMGRFLVSRTVLHLTSNMEKMECLKIVSPVTTVVLPNFVKVGEIQNRIIKKNPLKSFVFLSRIHEKKGLELTFKTLSKLTIPWELKIIGDGDQAYIADLKKLSESLNIQSNILWLGTISGSDKFEYLKNADYFILLSQNENFANVVVESLSVGTPVIISDQVGLNDYVLENNFGWVLPLNEELIEHNFNSVLSDDEKIEFVATHAPSKIRNDFYSIQLAKSYINFYSDMKKND